MCDKKETSNVREDFEKYCQYLNDMTPEEFKEWEEKKSQHPELEKVIQETPPQETPPQKKSLTLENSISEETYKKCLKKALKESFSKEAIHKILENYRNEPHPPQKYQMFSFIERIEWGIVGLFVLSAFVYLTYRMIVCGFSIKSFALWILGDFLAIIVGFFVLFPIMVIIDGLITDPKRMYRHWKKKLGW